MASRNIDDLHPRVAALCRQFVEKCKASGIDVLITSTYRSIEEQNAIYAQGRTTPGKIVTNAKGGQSMHNHHVAFDFVPIVAGKAMWNDTKTFEHCGSIAESLGLEWAGRWKKMKEMAHCQLTDGLTIKDFQAGKKLKD